MAVAGVAVPGCAGFSQPAPVLSGARSVCLDMRPIAIHKGCVLVAIEAILPRALRLRLLPAGLRHRRHCSTTEEGARRSITGQDMNTARSTHARGARGVSALDSDTADQTRSPRRLTAAGELSSGVGSFRACLARSVAMFVSVQSGFQRIQSHLLLLSLRPVLHVSEEQKIGPDRRRESLIHSFLQMS